MSAGQIRYIVVTDEKYPAAVGPFERHRTAFEWGEANIRNRGWRVVQLLPRSVAEHQLRRRRKREFSDTSLPA